MARTWMAGLVVLWLGAAVPALAQDDEEGMDEGMGEDEGFDEGSEADSGDEGADEAQAEPTDEAESDVGEPSASDAPREWYFGPFFRWMFVPAFMLDLFFDEAPTVGNPSFGATATHRGDNFNLVMGLGYTSYSFEDPFRISGDPETDTEYLESDLAMIHLTGSMLWETDFSEKVSFEYGFGLDLGIVLGQLVRTEAYRQADGSWAKCNGVLNPPTVYAPTATPYCEPGPVAYDEEGAHYNVVDERVPPVAPVPILPHLAVSWRPTPEWQIKGEFGTALLFTLWLGVSVGYAPAL